MSNDTQSPWGIALAIDGDKTTRVIWGENRGSSSNIVFHDPTASTTKKTLVGSDVWQVAVTGTLAFWATSSTSAGSVERCSITGCNGSPFVVIPSAPKVFGLVATAKHDLRDAFWCLEVEQIEPLFETVHAAIQELR